MTSEESEQLYDGMRPPHPHFTPMGYAVCVVAGLLTLFVLVCFWRIFAKAGRGGWKSLVPIYNGAVLLRIVGRPLWWLVPLCLPGIGLVPFVVALMDLGPAFGKGRIWGLFFPALAFGGARFVGPSAKAAASSKL